ncbi:MAG: hypothetical protein HXY34_00915 [Candidatus Thorarchaeota archaeon]|nr:hypothetical protein [Candidatus Thorarchaeota archaeon]
MRIEVHCPVYPTEDVELVRSAICNVVGTSVPLVSVDGPVSEFRYCSETRESLNHVRSRVHELRIIDAVRSRLLSNWDGLRTRIALDKQAALNRRIRLLDDSEETPPLGGIWIIMSFDGHTEFEALLSWLAPRTEGGRVIET